MGDPCDFENTNFTLASTKDYNIFENCTFNDNSSDFNFSQKSTVKSVFQFVFYSIAGIGNCLLLIVMYKDPLKRFRNSTSYFIINLAFADLLSTASGITQAAILFYPQDPKVPDTQENQNIAICINSIGIQCSLLMIMVFSLDRYMAIVRTFTYKNIVGKRYVVITIIVLPWCFAIVSLPVMYFASLTHDVQELLTRMLAGNFIALSIVTLTVHPYTHWVFLRKIEILRKSSSNHRQLLEENLKVAKVLATTVLVVSICLLMYIIPYFVAFWIHVAKCNKCFLSNTFQSLWKYYPLLSSIRVMINSVVYAWRLPLYRRSLKAFFSTCVFENRSMPENSIHNFNLHSNRMNGNKGRTDVNTKSTKDDSQSLGDSVDRVFDNTSV